MQDHRVTDREVGDAVAYRVDPAGVLVSQHIGQPGILNGLPLPLDDVQVGPADPGAADPDDDVQRARYLRLRDLVDRRILVVVVQPNSSHRACLPELDPTAAHPSRRAATTGSPLSRTGARRKVRGSGISTNRRRALEGPARRTT